MTPFVHFNVDLKWRGALRSLRDHDLGAAFVQFLDDPVRVERLVCEQGSELNTLYERCDADRIVAIAGKKLEAHQIAKRIRERQDLGRQPAFRLAYGLALSPPFAPCP